MLTLGVLGSGGGTNCQAVLDAIGAGRLDARVGCVVSDVESAYILERARAAGCPAYYVDCAPFKTKLDGEAEARVLALLEKHGVDFVVLAGFMRMVKGGLIGAYAGRMVNIHPALLPAFPGLESWRQALEYGVKVAGCTVHFVDAGMDTGPIIAQRTVPVLEGDTPEALHERIQAEEHRAFPEVLQWIAAGRVTVEGRRVAVASPSS